MTIGEGAETGGPGRRPMPQLAEHNVADRFGVLPRPRGMLGYQPAYSPLNRAWRAILPLPPASSVYQASEEPISGQ
jgi:hypothetical protein